jgi:hypothetical protein
MLLGAAGDGAAGDELVPETALAGFGTAPAGFGTAAAGFGTAPAGFGMAPSMVS